MRSMETEESAAVTAAGAQLNSGRTFFGKRGIVLRDLAVAAGLCAAIRANPSAAQITPATILLIDTENIVSYTTDVCDAAKFATDPNTTTVMAGARNFGFVMAVGDIVAVNGRPARGTLVVRQQAISLTPTPNPGQGVADTVRTAVSDYFFEIQQGDGTPVGNIHDLALSGGAPAVGSPLDTGSNHVIAGGTGAFLGVRGQSTSRILPGNPGPRTASVTEDPARRRSNAPGGKVQFVLQLIPMTRPEIAPLASGPAIFHADFSAVNAAKPAKSGEVLIAMATGLGPTRPGVALGEAFPAFPENPLQPVNSPIEATVNGRSAEVINSVGWPGMVNSYRVDFRVPDGTPAGTVSLQLTAAWVAGPGVQIAIQ